MLRLARLSGSIGAAVLMNFHPATAAPDVVVVAASAARAQASAATSSPSYTRLDIEGVRLTARMP